jgi:phosphatidylethanolamine/phosphatidyl-N-methylethanolamine N-methyltransferase
MTRSRATRTEIGFQDSTDAAYGRWAPFYDLIFDLPFHPGRLAAARAAGEAAGANAEILVVGVGTGLELGLLPKTARVTGIDLSTPMLKLARERVARDALGHVKSLAAMDARALEFPEGRFDVALAPYVMSVVPEPARVLDEMWRVVRPGGQIVVMNHFAADHGPRAWVEAGMEKSAGWLGWHPQFPYSAVGDWIAARGDAKLLERRQLAPFRLFTLLRVGKAQG